MTKFYVGTDRWNDNIYSNPEKHGCEIVAALHKQPDYDFDMIVVFRHIESGELRWGSDSGCSCPSPFENVRCFDEFDKLPETMFSLKNAVDEFSSSWNNDYPDVVERQEFIHQVEKELGL